MGNVPAIELMEGTEWGADKAKEKELWEIERLQEEH